MNPRTNNATPNRTIRDFFTTHPHNAPSSAASSPFASENHTQSKRRKVCNSTYDTKSFCKEVPKKEISESNVKVVREQRRQNHAHASLISTPRPSTTTINSAVVTKSSAQLKRPTIETIVRSRSTQNAAPVSSSPKPTSTVAVLIPKPLTKPVIPLNAPKCNDFGEKNVPSHAGSKVSQENENPLIGDAATTQSEHPITISRSRRPRGCKQIENYYTSLPGFAKEESPQTDAVEFSEPSSTSTSSRKRGKRKADMTPRELFFSLQPRYIEVLCEWGDCPAKLINLQILQKHVRKVHLEPILRKVRQLKKDEKKVVMYDHANDVLVDGKPFCLWRDCEWEGQAQSAKALLRHVLDEHIKPLQWHLGDGIAYDQPNLALLPNMSSPNQLPPPCYQHTVVNKNGQQIPNFLCSLHTGEQVTPFIDTLVIEEAAATRAKRKRLEDMWEARYDREEEESVAEAIAEVSLRTGPRKKMNLF